MNQRDKEYEEYKKEQEKEPNDYLEANKKMWNSLTEAHRDSNFYNVAQFKKDRNSLNAIEINEVGDVKGKSLLHLQCHFGMDTLSWANMGAKVTGMDMSDASIELAGELSREIETPANFVVSDVYSLRDNLQGEFDIVFTSYGAIGWLPDLNKWAEIVANYIKEGGFFYMVEFHPVIYMYEWGNNFALQYSYFNESSIVEEVEQSYTGDRHKQKQVSYSWNHSISEIINSLLSQGLQLEFFNEYEYSVYNCFPNLKEIEKGKFRFKPPYDKLPHTFSLKVRKPFSKKKISGRIDVD
ncbi:MAG: SAM-dependent methyltransferase [Flexibacter sp. CG_4_10_14_3_um_filter_32_15]|nr:MAG: SAM-dependent methyltransferase [Flexibacter sp. CG_4_10_14_3_um_filter_32_15]